MHVGMRVRLWRHMTASGDRTAVWLPTVPSPGGHGHSEAKCKPPRGRGRPPPGHDAVAGSSRAHAPNAPALRSGGSSYCRPRATALSRQVSSAWQPWAHPEHRQCVQSRAPGRLSALTQWHPPARSGHQSSSQGTDLHRPPPPSGEPRHHPQRPQEGRRGQHGGVPPIPTGTR